MISKKYDPPTATFPYRIRKRLNLMSRPHKRYPDESTLLPPRTPYGTRISALHGRATERINDAKWPYIHRFFTLKRLYKNLFTPERLERIDRMIEACNATIYAKMANAFVDLRREEQLKESKKKRGWSEQEWKKHMDTINIIALPRKQPVEPPVDRGPPISLAKFMPRLEFLATPPKCKVYRRVSQESWFKDPYKVQSSALRHVTTQRENELCKPKPKPPAEY